MYEADLYGPIKGELEKLLSTKGRGFGLEMTAAKAPSENLKSKIPQHREIVFAFLKKRPDIFGFVEGQYSVDLITVEIKARVTTLDDIYQAKLYKEVFDARYGFLITGEPIPEEIRRLCKSSVNILRSATDNAYRFLVIAQFDKESGQFIDWFEVNPFEKEHYWK